MAKQPPTSESPTAPEEYAQAAPRDLYETSDIRFVMREIGSLSTLVHGLKASVDRHGDKLDDLSHKVAFVKGAMWVIGSLITVGLLLLGWYLSGKLSVTYTPVPPGK